MLWVAILASLISLAFTAYYFVNIKKLKFGTPKMKEISDAIREGALAFLKREYIFLVVFIAVVAVLLYYFINPLTSLAFAIGAILSALAGNIGMRIATHANVRTTYAASRSLSKALRIAFLSGSVMGLSVVGLGLLGIALLYYFTGNLEILFGFGFGASSIALFARVGGGIYTKAADVGADLVGKVEAGIPEDDPRNPAVIADNVGDNVGDVAGMGADLFESYVGSIISAMVLGFTAFKLKGSLFPLAIASLGIIASIIGTFFVKARKQSQIHSALRNGLFVSSFLVLIGAYFLSVNYLGSAGVFWAILSGLLAGILIGLLTEYYTAAEYSPVKKLAKSSLTGSATTIIEGFALGMKSSALPVIVISIAIFVSYWQAGLFGIAIAAVGMLSTLGISLAVDAYGPVADNAGGIAEMAKLPSSVRKKTDALDSAGNTTAAIGKGFAIGSAALTVLALFSAYSQATGLTAIDIMNTNVIIGLLIGGLLPFLFSSMTMKAVGRSAFAMIEEVRRQFKKIKGLMEGKAKADYARCVDIATKGALKEMVVPGLLAVLAPVAMGLLLGVEALGGMLAGALVTGVLLAITMANAGGAWDNAKKFIESGKHGGKGSSAHKAAVTGDTVGDPFKDTSGPSLNILIKLMSIVSLVFVPLFLKYGALLIR